MRTLLILAAMVLAGPASAGHHRPHGRIEAHDHAASGRGAAGCDGRLMRTAFYSYSRGRTASGARFDRHAMTAAHRTLPFGTRLTVTHPHTGRTVTVTVNDRGPFNRGLQLDLTTGAARAIGLEGIASLCVNH